MRGSNDRHLLHRNRRGTRPTRAAGWMLAIGCAVSLVGAGLPGTASAAAPATAPRHDDRPRTVVTTDMEQDDLASLLRYLLYTDELDTQGIVYSSSKWHWAGPDNEDGTKLYTPGRWTGTRTIQDKVLAAYAQVYPNLRAHDRDYPTPQQLLAKVAVGNIASTGEMAHDSDGSDRIRNLLLDHDERPVYLQVWGGFNTVARALKSIEETYAGTPRWPEIHDRVSKKAVILASGLQDETYADYIAPTWPGVRVEELSAGYATWGYNCDDGRGNTRGLPPDRKYFTGSWIRRNIQVGPYGSLYRSWLDGQSMPGDDADVFGDPVRAAGGWCKPLAPYDFLSEGDNVAFNPLLDTGIRAPGRPELGGWGGRAVQRSASPDYWELVPAEQDAGGTQVDDYTTLRWAAAAQNDFAARMQWTLTPTYEDGNHAPTVSIRGGGTISARPGSTVRLTGVTADPDGDRVSTTWWQYREEGTYPGAVAVTGQGDTATVAVPSDARAGDTVSVIMQGTDDGGFPLTRYDRVTVRVTGRG
ncbi:DUF1593 domain-containing protein [Streptomyces odontomachi]|uniref:DUF1593 domain-containing protein n=1 Tax=Streptomyces odontomachi TaxID=2944940 RepID=UPI002108AE7D|nr:nucleoside hydrolase-like domain-containing protein [Streptomyces sp. ODS25]